MTTPVHKKIPLAERRTLTVKDACDYASIGQSKLFEFIKSGKVQALRLSGRHTLILRKSLDKLLTPAE